MADESNRIARRTFLKGAATGAIAGAVSAPMPARAFGLTGDQVVFKVNIMVAHFNPFH